MPVWSDCQSAVTGSRRTQTRSVPSRVRSRTLRLLRPSERAANSVYPGWVFSSCGVYIWVRWTSLPSGWRLRRARRSSR